MGLFGNVGRSLKAWIATDVIADVELTLRNEWHDREQSLKTEADTRVREAMSAGLSRQDEQLAAEGFRPIGPGNLTRYFRELPPLLQDRMLRIVFWLWERNPLARWSINATVDFVMGESVTVTSDDETVREVIDTFWTDPVNRLDLRLNTFAMEFGLYGELCLPVAVNEQDGHARLAYVDPLDIEQVITDPDNVLVTTAVKLKGTAGGRRGRLLKVVREETNRASSYFGRLMPNLPGEHDPYLEQPYDGACFLWQTNKVSNGRRGRSDILSLIDWLDGYDAFLFDSMDGAMQFNSFLWDVTLNNMNETQVADWLAKYGQRPAKRGEVRAHNEHVAWKEVTPDLKAVDKDQFARLYRGHILGSQSFPEHWFGQAGDVNLASSKEMGGPPIKRLTRRQNEVRQIIGDLIRFQIHQKIRVGILKPEVVIGTVTADGSKGVTKRTDQAFAINMPELSMRDQTAIIAGLAGLTAALMQAEAKGYIRPETAAKLWAHQVSQLGLEVVAEDEASAAASAAGPGGAGLQDYGGVSMARLLAQLQRMGNGNGDNALQPKGDTAAARAAQ